MASGPLSGLKIVEFAGIGPGPFCGMLLSDLGADVVRIDRKGSGRASPADVTSRGRRSIALDLKSPEATEACLKLFESADAVFEGFRPGVMERLGADAAGHPVPLRQRIQPAKPAPCGAAFLARQLSDHVTLLS